MNNDYLMNDFLWLAGLVIIAIAFSLFGLSAWWHRRNKYKADDNSPATRGGRRRHED